MTANCRWRAMTSGSTLDSRRSDRTRSPLGPPSRASGTRTRGSRRSAPACRPGLRSVLSPTPRRPPPHRSGDDSFRPWSRAPAGSNHDSPRDGRPRPEVDVVRWILRAAPASPIRTPGPEACEDDRIRAVNLYRSQPAHRHERLPTIGASLRGRNATRCQWTSPHRRSALDLVPFTPEANGGWCPSRSSKPVDRREPVGGFDSRPPPPLGSCRLDLRRTRWAPEELRRLPRRLDAAVEVPEPRRQVESRPAGARSVASGRTRGAMPMPDRPRGENRGAAPWLTSRAYPLAMPTSAAHASR